MALAAGVDLVVELPLPWACSSAPDFGRGGVQGLSRLGAVASLCFGSELGYLEPLQRCADFLAEEAESVAGQTAKLLRRGMTYPQARAVVLAAGTKTAPDAATLAAPNNILGIEYLKALKELPDSLAPLTIPRIGAGYHDLQPGQNGIASATGIRRQLAAGDPVDSLVPAPVAAILERALCSGQMFAAERYFEQLLGQIFRNSQELDRYWLVDDGIERRLLDGAERAADLEDLIACIKSRQLTRTRVQRLLVSVLLGLEKAAVRELLNVGPRYLHLLALSDRGRAFLAATRKSRSVPLIQNFSRVYATLKRRYGAESPEYWLAVRQLDLEVRATRLYSLLLQRTADGPRNRDFYEQLRT